MIPAVAWLLAAAPRENAKMKEFESFQGTWRFVSLEIEGKKLDLDDLKDARLIVKEDAFTRQAWSKRSVKFLKRGKQALLRDDNMLAWCGKSKAKSTEHKKTQSLVKKRFEKF
jgi:hypothetical protein